MFAVTIHFGLLVLDCLSGHLRSQDVAVHLIFGLLQYAECKGMFRYFQIYKALRPSIIHQFLMSHFLFETLSCIFAG